MPNQYQPQSFYETTLGSAITAVQTTIPVTVAPNITSGYLVIEANTSNREIIKYTGVSGTTLTGVVRGLAEYGSDDSAGTGKAHSAGVDIACKDVHYYYAKYYDILTGVSATGYNDFRIGDGSAVSSGNKFWYVNTSSVSSFWGLSASGQMVVSEDGVTSYVISAGGSGIAAGDGIDITAGTASVALLSTGGLRVSATKIAVDFGQGLSATSANELYIDQTTDYTWTGDHTFNANIKTTSPIETDGYWQYFDADEVIVVSSHPKPVKLTSAGRVYMVSSNSISNLDPYIGFAITASSAAGSEIKVQTAGFVNGFTGLTRGSYYYAGGQGGEYSTTPGTAELQLGLATSQTDIFINKGNFEYIGTANHTYISDDYVYVTVPIQTKKIILVMSNYIVTAGTRGIKHEIFLDRYGKTTGTIWDLDTYAGGSIDYRGILNANWVTSAGSIHVSASGLAAMLALSATAYFYR